MTVKPMLFSTPMVQALLAGRKTQTRRILKPQPFVDAMGNFCTPEKDGRVKCWGQGMDGKPYLKDFIRWAAPYAVGDLLWVRETWALDDDGRHCYKASRLLPPFVGGPATCRGEGGPKLTRWRPSIHMARRASRLTIEVTEVRVERLQAISEEDARSEGVACDSDGWRDYQSPETQCCGSARDSFRTLWDSLNAKRGFGWATNPWVCPVRFTVHRANVDDLLRQREAA